MATRHHEARSSGERFCVERMPFALLDEPLEYIFADHFRQRSVIGALRRFASEASAPRHDADAVIAFMTRDLRWHHEDEDEDLFPLLRRRAVPEDDIGVALARLTADHRDAESMERGIVDALSGQVGKATLRLDKRICEMMTAYAASEHRHLAVENGIILAIARIRLTRSDLQKLSVAMKTRRGGIVDVAHA